LNVHGVAPAATSRLCVCQFRHIRIKLGHLKTLAQTTTSSKFPAGDSVPTRRKLLIFNAGPFPGGPIRSRAEGPNKVQKSRRKSAHRLSYRCFTAKGEGSIACSPIWPGESDRTTDYSRPRWFGARIEPVAQQYPRTLASLPSSYQQRRTGNHLEPITCRVSREAQHFVQACRFD
jgi:hypothetical protein